MLLRWLMGVAWGNPECAPGIDEFRHEVTVVSSSVVNVVDTYRFSVPNGVCTEIELPRAINGFQVVDSDLKVADGKLTRKGQWAEGDVLLVQRLSTMGRGPYSAEVLRPAFPVETMSVELDAPSYVRLNVWTEPHAEVAIESGRRIVYRASFQGGGRLVWSNEKNWWAVGARLKSTVDGRIASRWALGELAAGYESLSIEDALKRASNAVALAGEGDWRTARPAATVIKGGSGTAAERAIVLLSVLRAAGYDADPVLVRPVGAPDLPLVVPGHAVFSRMAIRVHRPGNSTVWLDPASRYTRVDSVPRELRGAVVLISGDQPHTLLDRMVPDGRLKIQGTITLADDGSVEVSAEVTAEDGAMQAVRDVLGPLARDTRKQWLSDLLRVVRPDLEDLQFQVFGIDDPSYPFGMTVEFDSRAALRPLGAGRAGAFPAILAPQLARVLPPNIEVVESFVVKGTDTLQLYGVRPVEDPVDGDAIVNRFMSVDGRNATLSTLALRPWRSSTRAAETAVVLDEASLRGPELVFFGVLDKAAARALQKEVTNSDTRVMEGLLWYQADAVEEAEKALRRAVRTGRIRDVADALRRYAERGDPRPWEVVWQVVDDVDRMAIVEALEAKNELREAWRRASRLLTSPDVSVQIEALLTVARVQGEKPAANIDEAGHKAWREPTLLLARAEKLAQSNNAATPAIDVAFADRLMAKGLCDKAGPRIQRAFEKSRDPFAAVVHEEWRTCSETDGEPADLEALIVESNYDPAVMRTAVRVWTARNDTVNARRWAVLAALLEQDDADMWSAAADASLAAGDLDTAVYAARNASDLKPKALTTGVPLQILATLNGDLNNAELATRRSSYQVSIEPFPISMANADSFMEERHRLAFLRVRDDDVLASAELTRERFRRNEAAGNRTDALRDAAWLVKAHRTPTAAIDAYRATAGQLWSTHPLELLNSQVRDKAVRKLRMESALLTGVGDPLSDANVLRGDPAAELIREARYKSSAFAKRKGWPEGLSNPKVNVPVGYRSSKLLGTLKGVVGFTNSAAGSILLVSSAGDLLPPPLEGTFRLGEVLETDGSTTTYRLEGGIVPGVVAKRTLGELTFWGAARSAQLAEHALESGLVAQSF